MTRCPCCGYDGTEPVGFPHIAAMARLSILETSVFLLFASRIGLNVSLDAICDHVYSMTRDGGPASAKGVIGVTIHRMNKKLKPFGLVIKGENGCGHHGRRMVWIADEGQAS